MLVAARVNDLPGMFDPWARYLTSLRRAVLLWPTVDDAFLFGVKLPVIPPPMAPGRGLLIDRRPLGRDPSGVGRRARDGRRREVPMTDRDLVAPLQAAIARADPAWVSQPSHIRRRLLEELGADARRHRAQVHQLVVAAEERIPIRLRRNGWSPGERDELGHALVASRGWTPDAADWAVTTVGCRAGSVRRATDRAGADASTQAG